MNKKFSTLVAALLVTGGSFAMVSQYAGTALAESPLAMAATANLRTASDTEQGEGAFLQIVAGEAKVWGLSNGVLSAGGRNLLVKNGNVGLTTATGSAVSIEDDGKIKVGGQYLVISDNSLAVSDNATGAVALYDKNTKKVITIAAATEAILGTWHAEEAGELGTTDLAITGLTAPVTATLATGGTGADGSVLNTPTDNRVFELVGTTASFKIKLGEAYVKANAAGSGIELTFDENDAAACSFAESTNEIKVGAKFLSIDSENTITLAGANTNAVKAYTSASAQVITLPVTANNGKVALTKSVTVSQSDVLIAAPTNMPVAPKITVGAAGATPAKMNADATSAQGNSGFTLRIGTAYLAVDAENNVTVSGNEGAAMFTSDAETNNIRYGNQYLKISADGLSLVNGLGDEDHAVRAYGAENKAQAIEAGEQVIAAAVDDVKAAYNEETDQCVSYELTAAVLKDGGVYAISNGGYSLALGYKNGTLGLYGTDAYKGQVSSLLRAAASINDVLWTVEKGTVGGEDFYAFTHVATGLPLAFSVAGDGVLYDVEGDYDTFKIEGNHLTFKVNGTTYYIKIDNTSASASPSSTGATVTFGTAHPVETPESVDGVKAAVKLLNVTYGTGNGFGVMFKDRALDEEKVKDVTLESNPFTDNTIITAVPGPDNLNSKMFLKVAGSYTGKETTDAKQIEAFRAATFIAVDTIRYSAFVNDIDADNNFYKYTTVKGSQMMNEDGESFTAGTTIEAADLKKGGNWYGVTRRIENAQFKISQAAGATVEDAIEFIVPEAYIPAANNGQAIALNGHNVDPVENLKLAIKQFNKKNYVGALKGESWPYIYIGLNNDVDYKTVNGIVTIVSRNYKTDGQPYATTNANGVDRVLAKYVSLDKPEGQFLVTGGDGTPFWFQNRESGLLFKDSEGHNAINLKKTDTKNVYSVVGTKDTIEIKAAAAGDKFIGYANYDAKALENTAFVLKVVSNVAGIQDIYIAEDHNKDHSLGLNADTLEAANFKLIKFEGAAVDEKDYDKLYGDTVFVSTNEYSYVAVDKKTKEEYYDTTNDYVVAFTYAIYNADNGEFLDINYDKGVTKAEYVFCNPKQKGMAYKNVAQRFIIKEKANGAIQLIPVEHLEYSVDGSIKADDIFTTLATAENKKPVYLVDNPESGKELAGSKLYSGISDNKIYKNTDGIYKVADNDLFTIQEIGAPLYRTLENEVYDKVRIYKEGMKNVALFAESADKALVSGANWLGMEHKADADLNKTMFSFVLDTAYVDRGEKNYKPEYLLAIDSEVIPSVKYCDEHGINPDPDCGHTTQTIAYMKGSYLVNLADSANAWDKNAHVNPYKYGEYDRLGFVKATHVKDQLIIERGAPTLADTLNLTKGNSAKFALKIVDQATKSFVLENGGAYLKWLNGVPVMVGALAEAEVLNIEATENAATANEAIEASAVQVIAGKGVVTVQGAAGKVVTVANILGQTIANQVAASDNVTIAAPAGIVVVAVEGEATKVVVK